MGNRGHGILRCLVLAGCAALPLMAAAGARAETARWTRTYGGPAGGSDAGWGVAVSADGDVYVVGSTAVAGQAQDLLLRKYSATGVPRWSTTYNGAANGSDVGVGVAASADGGVYVTGCTWVEGQGKKLLLQRYSPAGARRWSRTYGGRSNDSDYCGYGVAAAADGGAYVVGVGQEGTGGTSTLILQRYTPLGTRRWAQSYRGDSGGGASGYGVAVGENGNVYVTGEAYAHLQESGLLLRKYSPAGAPLWTKTYKPTAGSAASGKGVAATRDGAVYVAGSLSVDGAAWGVLLQKYTPAGARRWTRTYRGRASYYDHAYDVAVGANGGVYVAGLTSVDGQMSNLQLQRYSATGALRWTATYNGAANGRESGFGVAAARDGSVYVTGETFVEGEDVNLILRKYQ